MKCCSGEQCGDGPLVLQKHGRAGAGKLFIQRPLPRANRHELLKVYFRLFHRQTPEYAMNITYCTR